MVSTFDTDVNFWEQYPQLKIAGAFKKLYNSDKSRNKAVSSKKMWCVALIWDRDSKWFNSPEDLDSPESKIVAIFRDHYGDLKTYTDNIDTFEELKEEYLRIQETPARRSLREIEYQIEERSAFLRSIKYDMGTCDPESGRWIGNTADIKDKMMSNTDKIYALYEKALKAVENENALGSKNKGGGESSLSDDDEI
jgi:hypothetical protein